MDAGLGFCTGTREAVVDHIKAGGGDQIRLLSHVLSSLLDNTDDASQLLLKFLPEVLRLAAFVQSSLVTRCVFCIGRRCCRVWHNGSVRSPPRRRPAFAFPSSCSSGRKSPTCEGVLFFHKFPTQNASHVQLVPFCPPTLPLSLSPMLLRGSFFALAAALVSSVAAISPGFSYGSQKVRGVNLGGWLVL